MVRLPRRRAGRLLQSDPGCTEHSSRRAARPSRGRMHWRWPHAVSAVAFCSRRLKRRPQPLHALHGGAVANASPEFQPTRLVCHRKAAESRRHERGSDSQVAQFSTIHSPMPRPLQSDLDGCFPANADRILRPVREAPRHRKTAQPGKGCDGCRGFSKGAVVFRHDPPPICRTAFRGIS